MRNLRIHFLGSLRISHDGDAGEIRLTPVIQSLLAYLLLNHDQPHPRDVLAELFWGNYSQERARSCLNTAMWRLRQMLEPKGVPGGTYLINSQQGKVGFNLNSPYWFDVQVFQEQIRPVIEQPVEAFTADNVAACEQSLLLYRGDLLPGLYSDWVIRQREQLRLTYLKVLSALSNYYKAQRNYEKSLHYAWRILDLDPLREDVHREVMRLLVACGQRAVALKQYETCRSILKEGMGIGPMEETYQLYLEIRGDEMHPANLPQEPAPTSLALALIQLKRTEETFEQVQKQLKKAMQLLEGLASDLDR